MNSGESRYYKYSLLNPEDEKKLIAKWGGENVIKRKYPAVWTAIQNTKEYEHEVKRVRGDLQGIGGDLKVSAPGFPDKGNKKRSGESIKGGLVSVIKLSLEDGTYISNQAPDTAEGEPISKKWPAAVISGSIDNLTDGYGIASFTKTFRDINSAEEQMITDKIYDGTDFSRRRVRSYAHYSGIDFNGNLHDAECILANQHFTDDAGDIFVRDLSVSAPYSKQANNPIKMLYDRGADSGEVIDYSYKNVRDATNQQVKTSIPLKMQIEFIDEVSINDPVLDAEYSFKPSLTFGNPPKKHVVYNREWDVIKKAFTVNGKILTIDFSKINDKDDWNYPMMMANYTTGSYEVGRTVELHATFHINMKWGEMPTKVPISIVSCDNAPDGFHFYHTSSGYSVYIPKINIRWGCFGEGTLITMADGSRIPVELIRRGNILFTTSGPLPVREIYAGREAVLLHICTEGGKKLRVTHTHPIVLEGGRTIQARSVRPGYRVMSGDGKTDRVKWVYECAGHGMVYNFEFSDGKEHVVEADGILAGEFIAQNSVKAAGRKQFYTPQMQSLTEQFIAMHNAARCDEM